MFRAAFPTAGDEAEKIDSSWVKSNYDLTGANGGGKLRLAGTWVPPTLAVHLAPSYSLSQVVYPLAEAQPDAGASYRKSSRHTTNGPVNANMNALSSPLKTNRTTPNTTDSPNAPPSKRTRRESSSPVRARVVSSSPLKQSALPTTVEEQEAHTSPPPEGEAEPEVPGPDMEEDLAESKALIARLKKEKEERLQEQELSETAAEQDSPVTASATAGAKRGREATPPIALNLDRQLVDTSDRQLVRSRSAQQANRRSAMWGAVAFAVGLGVT
jgi:hypothetical protein